MRTNLKSLILAVVAAGLSAVTLLAQDDPTLEKIRQARYVAASPKIPSLGLVHYSDIHGDNVSAVKLGEMISRYSPYIDAVVCSGDVVHYYAEATADYKNDFKWWKGTGLPEKSLFVLGNHDGAVKSNAKGHLEGSADWDFKGKEWAFDTYFADYISSVGYVMPEGYDKPSSPYYKSCFWYKDFPEAKVRIIGVDCIHYNDGYRYLTGEQEEWLAARLSDTLDPSSEACGYSVLVVGHYPLDDYDGDNEAWDEASHRFSYNHNPEGGRVMDSRTGNVVNFHTYGRRTYSSNVRFSIRNKVSDKAASYGYTKGDVNPVGDVIQAWVDNGGKFIAWLCGHCHADLMFYPAKYPDLLCVTVDQAGDLRGSSSADRPEDSESRLCANYYGIDTQNGLFKIVRLGGLVRDRFMVEKNVLCYDYLNRKVIFE